MDVMNPTMQVRLTGYIPTGSWPPAPLRRLQDHPIFVGTAHRWQQRLEGLVETHTFIPSAKGCFPWDVEKMEQAKTGEIIEPSIRNGAHDGSWLSPRSKGALAASQHHWYDIIFSFEILWTPPLSVRTCWGLVDAFSFPELFLSARISTALVSFTEVSNVAMALEITSFVPSSPEVPHARSVACGVHVADAQTGSPSVEWCFSGAWWSPLEFNEWLGEPQKNDFPKGTSSFSIAAKTILSHSCCIPCGFAKGICQGQKLAELRSLRKTHVKI